MYMRERERECVCVCVCVCACMHVCVCLMVQGTTCKQLFQSCRRKYSRMEKEVMEKAEWNGEGGN